MRKIIQQLINQLSKAKKYKNIFPNQYNETLTTCTALIMSWKLRWAGWNKVMKRYTKADGSYGYADPFVELKDWLGNRKR